MYWSAGGFSSVFAVRRRNPRGRRQVYQVLKTFSAGITRYVKIKAAANPYDPAYGQYYWRRRNQKGTKQLGARSAREFRAQFA
jgi:hypothetical protein